MSQLKRGGNMNREIELKAFIKLENIIVDILQINWMEKYIYYIDDKDEWQREKFKDVEIIQSTGLFDKNGKEIYEGDLLQSNEWNCNCQVVWNGGGFTLLEGETSSNLENNLTDADGFEIEFEVIGNIYENPELLKES
jgi:uncharacterized phage protein (TIGR01671 family)